MSNERYAQERTDSHVIITDTKTGVEHKFAERMHYLEYDGPLPSPPDDVESVAADTAGKMVA